MESTVLYSCCAIADQQRHRKFQHVGGRFADREILGSEE
jgi:hypothetical protein